MKEVELKAGSTISLMMDDSFRTSQTKDKIWISYKKLFTAPKQGTKILLDDGAVEIVVNGHKAGEISCTVLNSGVLGNKKGVNIPGSAVDLPAMCDKDKVSTY